MSGRIVIPLAGAGQAGPPGVAGPAVTPPGNVTGVILEGAISGMGTLQLKDYTVPDADGNVFAQIKVTYTAPTTPSPLPPFTGVHLFAEFPDGSGATPRTTMGTGVLGTATLNPPAQTLDLGKVQYDPGNIPSPIVKIAPKAISAACRIYVVSVGDKENDLVLATEPSPTPSAVIQIAAKPAGATPGIEYAPLALDLTLVDRYPRYRLITGGSQQYQYALDWTDPVDDPLYPALTGYAVALDEPLEGINGVYDPGNARTDTYRQDQISRINDGQATFPGRQPFVSPWHDVPNVNEEIVTVWFDSFSGDGSKFNSIIPGVTPSVQFRIKPQAPGTDQLYAPDVTDLACTPRYAMSSDGQKAMFFDVTGVEHIEDGRYNGVELTLYNDDNPGGAVLTGRGENLPSSPWIVTGWPTAPDTWTIVALSQNKFGEQNPYLPGTSPSVAFPVVPTTDPDSGVQLQDVTGFSVDPDYPPTADYDGKMVLTLTPIFTRPPDDASWNSIGFWALTPPSYAPLPLQWVLLGFPDGPSPAIITALPTAVGNWSFAAVALDVNGKNKDGDPTTTGGAFPAFTPTYGPISIGPPALGSVGQERCDVVTGFSITLGSAIKTPDGTYLQSTTAQWTRPTDTRFGSVDLAIHYDQTAIPITPDELPFKVRLTESPAVFSWKIPNPSQAVRWYALSRDVNDRPNTLNDPTPSGPGGGVTPFYNVTAGDSSQLDLSEAALERLYTQFGPALMNTLIGDQLQIGGGNKNGTVNTAGTAVTKASGDNFDSTIMLEGYPITIDGTVYPIDHVVSTTSLVLKTTAGTHTGVNYSFGRPPQLRFFDRNNVLMIWMGDDTQPGGSGLIGAWLGRGVRLGGPNPANPVIDIDDATGVTSFQQPGSTYQTSIINGEISVDDMAGTGVQTVLHAGVTTMYNSAASLALSTLISFFGYSGSGPFGPLLRFTQFRGVPTAATATQTSDVLGGFGASGSETNGSDFQAGVFVQATEAQSGGTKSGTQVVIQTSLNGSGQGTQRNVATFSHDGYADVLSGYKLHGTVLNTVTAAVCSSTYTLTTTYTTITGMSINLPTNGVYEISVDLEISAAAADGIITAQLVIDSSVQAGIIEMTAAGLFMQTKTWDFTYTSGSGNAIVRAKKSATGAGSSIQATNSSIRAKLLRL